MEAKYRCCSCAHIFNQHQAICEDWRVPEKSLICPECKSYLALDFPRGKKWIVGLALLSLFVGLFARSFGSQGMFLLTALGILFLLLVHGWHYGNPFGPARTKVVLDEKWGDT